MGRRVTCVVCGHEHVHAKNRCRTCYRYLRKHGTDRTEDMIAKAEHRRVIQELEARLWRHHP